jgi:hypothetical protein
MKLRQLSEKDLLQVSGGSKGKNQSDDGPPPAPPPREGGDKVVKY